MSLIRLSRDNFETFTMVLHPSRSFASSSASGATGSLNVHARNSTSEKDVNDAVIYNDSKFFENKFLTSYEEVKKITDTVTDPTNILNAMTKYLNDVNALTQSDAKTSTVTISRWVPGVRFTENTIKKNTVRDQLLSYYGPSMQYSDWAFTNYHTLNFFTASTVPQKSALIYPNSASSESATFMSGVYALTGAFSFDFYINARYTTDEPDAAAHFKAGTIFHMSSSYAVSLVTGSRRDVNGYPDGFRLLLQFLHSTDTKPSLCSPAAAQTYPNDLIFFSDDNSLSRNHWHHVTIAWGTSTHNDGTGSILVDGMNVGNFVIPSASIAPSPLSYNPAALVVGNYFEGPGAGVSTYLAADPALRDGLVTMDTTTGIEEPAVGSLLHPLNAELHDIKIYNKRLSNDESIQLQSAGPKSLHDVVFYVGPFFTRESPTRRFVGDHGGVLQTPFFSVDSTTDDPFNVALSFGIAGHDINLENFVMDLANGLNPRLLNLTGSEINNTTEAKTANEFLYSTGSIVKRNATLLPCDNGLFKPNFRLLMSGTHEMTPESGHAMDHYVDDNGVLNLSLVTLNEMVPTSSLRPGLIEDGNNILSGVLGASPENPGVDPGDVLTVFQRTRDNTSNEVAFFDISNLYYGNSIKRESFVVTDPALTGTDGKVKITLKDNGAGALHRADAHTPPPSWTYHGFVLYEEGIACVLDPTIALFGLDAFSMDFNGVQNVHVMKVHAVASTGMINSSSNPSYALVSASSDAHDVDSKFVYITGVNFHDDNLNVVMRSQLAQPVIKRVHTKLKFVSKLDF